MATRFQLLLAAVLASAFAISAGIVAGADADNAGQIGSFGEYGTDPGKLANPNIFGAEPHGSVFVGDQPEGYASERIQKFSSTGVLEGGVTIPTPGEEAFQGIAVDPVKGRFYLLRDHEGSDTSTGRALAETILVFSTTPDGSGGLVAPSGGPSELPVPNGADSIDDPTEIALDPHSGELQILGTNRAGKPVLQRIVTSGSGSIGLRYDETTEAPGIPSYPELGMALGPDGTTYVVGRSRLPEERALFVLPPGPTGKLTAVPAFATAQGQPPFIGPVNSGFVGHGAQLAVSDDGTVLYYKQENSFSGTETAGNFQVLGYSLGDGSARSIYGGGSEELKCAIQTKVAALAVVGDGIDVLDQGSEAAGLPSFGIRVLRFGPGGSSCPAPSASSELRTSAGEVSTVPEGTSVMLDGTGSEVGQWGERFESATWVVEGPGGTFKETVPGRLTLEHTFEAPGTYVVRLTVKAKIKSSSAPPNEPTVYGAAPQTLTVISGGGGGTLPSVTGVAPSSGPAAGGNTVKITGSHLEGATGVKFGSVAATGVKNVDAGTVTAVAPAGGAGSVVDVTVTNGAGTSARGGADKYTYEGGGSDGPSVTSVSPAHGVPAGGNLVTIGGSHLDGATAVEFGTAAATDVTAVNSTTVTAKVPPGAPGTTVDVVVTTAAGPTELAAGDRYQYEVLTQPLGVVKVGSGSGTVSSTRPGIDCGDSCGAAFPQGATVVLTASPASGSTFAGWGGACSGQGICVVGMTTTKGVSANFEAVKPTAAARPSAPAPASHPAAPKCKAPAKPKTVAGQSKCVAEKKSKGKHQQRKKHRHHRKRKHDQHGGKHHRKGH